MPYINGPVARNSDTNPDDVRTIKTALNRLGYYMPDKDVGTTPWPDDKMFQAIAKFQKDHHLENTGTLKPDDTTTQGIDQAIEDDPHVFYIWRTVDDDLVRPEHADREGKVFSWENPPKGGNPSESLNCRCWAESLTDAKISCTDHPKSDFLSPDFDPLQYVTDWNKFNAWQEDAKQVIAKNEGIKSWPYFDTKSLLTTGVGFNIDIERTFKSLPWRIDSEDGELATAEEIDTAYDALAEYKNSYQPMNIIAKKQEDWSNLRLNEADIAILFQDKIDLFTRDLIRKFPNFLDYPDSAKTALMDVIYNLGNSRFREKKWPGFFDAVKNRDWERAAKESHRNIPHQDRNIWTSEQFLNAAIEDANSC